MVSDRQLFDKAEEAWRNSWQRFYCEKTNLFYDWVSSYDADRRLGHLPTLEEISRQFPNRNGWATGMEDSAISAGVMLSLVCDRFDVTGETDMGEVSERVLAGMVRLGTLSPSEGFIMRSLSPIDGKSHYIESSRDQYTWYAYAFWRFYHSSLSTDNQKETMRKVITSVCERLERNVVPGEKDFHIGREDGTFDGLVDKMWNVAPHEVARLPMIYAIGFDLTGERHWWNLYRQYAEEAAAGSIQVPLEMSTPYAFLQEQISLEPLHELETEDAGLKSRWQEAMQFVARRSERFAWQCLRYRPVDLRDVRVDWRSWPRSDGGVPQWPEEMSEEGNCIRGPAEGLLSQLLCPGNPLPHDQLELMKRTLTQVDYDKTIFYGLFYTQAAYWRAVKLGLLSLPD